MAMLAATVATVIAALLPARRAARLNPVDVMR
jgi:ABC-type lipoprotein release transport system permease subunit